MRISARLEETTVVDLLRQLLPVTVILEEDSVDRWIRIDAARQVSFVAGEGLRVEVEGQVRWKAAGLPVLLTIKAAQLLIRPTIENDEEGDRLVFRPSLEHMDLKNVPDFLDSGLTSIINKRLGRQGDTLAWHFGRTLTHEFPLAKEFVDVDRFRLGAGAAGVEVTGDALELKIWLTAGFIRLAEG